MKLTVVLIISCFLQVSAATYAQKKITISAQNAPLESVLKDIRKQSQTSIFFIQRDLRNALPVTLNLKDVSLEEALEKCFRNQPLTYVIDANSVVIKEKIAAAAKANKVSFTVSGRVKDNSNLPLPGVSVRVKNTDNVKSTDNQGKYSIQVELKDSLEFSYIGYAKQTVGVKGLENIDVTMIPVEGSLEEVAVVGFGKQKKISIVGAIQSIKPDELRIPTSNISNAFAGKLAGVIAVQRSGQPGADGSSFFIRGISTFNGATNPLIILDGVAVSSGDLNALAPEVIESFSILKDATATAIYGSRGANGVMIVTTKSGKDMDKPKINVRIENSTSSPTKVPEFVSGSTYMELFNETILGRGSSEVPYTADKIDGTRNGLDKYVYPNINWYEEMFKKSALNQTVNLNVLGGGKKVDYFLSATLSNNSGLIKNFDVNTFSNNISVKRYSFQNNLNANLGSETRVSLKLNTQLRDYHGPAKNAENIFADIMDASPVDFPLMFPNNASERRDVLFGGRSGGNVNAGYLNPFAEMVRGYTDNFQTTVIATFDAEQKLNFITEGLSLKGLASFKNFSATNTIRSGGYNNYEVKNLVKNPDGTYKYDLGMIGTPQSAALGTTNSTSGDRMLYFQTSLEYNKTLAEKHNFSGLLLYNQEEYNVNNPSDLITSLPRRRQGLAGRMTYGYDNRYLAEFNFGYNGSENFAKGKRFGFFPSVAVGYVLSSEPFFKSLAETISLLKFRASWGKVGNDQIAGARFLYMSDLNLTGQGYTTGLDMNYTKSGPTFLRFTNNDISWEVGEKINVGMDVNLMNKLNIVVDIYRENRSGIFLQRAGIPGFFGTDGTNVYSNIGKVRNQGLDLALDYNHDFGSGFFMTLKGTFTYARNKVINNDEPLFTKYKNLSAVGYPIGTPLGYVADRLFIDEADIKAHSLQQIGGVIMPGDIKYVDITNSIDKLNIINSSDMMRMGHPGTPEIIYGLGPSFKLKKFDFSFFFQGVANTSFFINGFHPFGPRTQRNVLTFVAEQRWRADSPNPYATYPRLTKLDLPNNTENSSYWLRDASFLKLRNVEMGYTYKSARLYLSGYNVMTFSKFKYWDPEQGGGNGLGYPSQRIFNIGLQMGF
ncbi:TonB-dependent receptor [Pedobacter frigoris]|uniref:TonB-dependent receptor n=1 Tax=Pedobacter frigoris TaxID=2571272 RepID=UPI00292E15CF|nr:TonB-dependent receptor [Pedobacter frigoris]